MNKYIFPLVFVVILLVSIFTRASQISSNPPALFSDEVDAAYQALVFNNCQTDYYGHKFPIHFKSGSDYRTPAMIYGIALSQKIFGINNFSVRFPSLFFGILIPVIFYLIGKHLVDTKLGLILFAISATNPWLIHYSRAAFEVSSMIFFVLASIYLWLRYIKSKKLILFFLSVTCLIITTYFYSTAKLFALFIFIAYICLSIKQIKKHQISRLFTSIAMLIIISLPMMWSTIKGEAGYRFSYINIFTEPTLASQVDYYRYLDIKTDNQQLGVETPFSSKVFHNKYLSVLDTFTKNYFSSLSTEFLFNQGDSNIRHGFRQLGYFYPIELIFLITGLAVCFKQKKQPTVNLFFFVLLILSPIPYSLTRDSLGPHATRLIIIAIPIIYFFSQGSYYLIKKFNTPIKLILTIIYIFFFANFIHYYYLDYPHLSANAWHSGIAKAIQKSDQLKDNYSSIYFSDKYEPTLIFYLYHEQIIPQDECNIYQAIPYKNLDYFSGHVLNNKIFFGNIEWAQVTKNFPLNQNDIYIIPESEINTVSEGIKPFIVKPIFITKNKYETEIKFMFFVIQEDEKNKI